MEQDKLSGQALLLKSVIETAIDGIITIDEMGIVTSINPAAANLFGYHADEVIGHNIKMLMPSPYKDQHDGYLHNYKTSGKPKIIGIGREVEGKCKDGSVFPMRLAVSEVKIDGQRIFTGIIHDLTDVKKAEAEVLKLNKELEQKVKDRTEELSKAVNKLLQINAKMENEIRERKAIEEALLKSQQELKEALDKEIELNLLKSRFVSMASHEFRTPLSTILSSAELVEAYNQKSGNPKSEKHIIRIKSAVANLTGILNDFLSLSRLEEGQIAMEPEQFNLREFCEEIIDELKGLLKKGQQLVHEGENDDQLLYLDKKFLRNILFNLISNGVKYSEEGKTVLCRTKISDNLFTIEIIDQGIGIPEADQVHLFTRFFRAHNVENIKGTGLGLHIVKRYIDLMKGTISFNSKLGEGSTFMVKIPVQ